MWPQGPRATCDNYCPGSSRSLFPAWSAPGEELGTSVQSRRGMAQPGGRKLEGKAVLRGPKLPTWACSKCDRTANWASRVVCACGCKAPGDIARKARQAHDKLEASGRAPRRAQAGQTDVSSIVEQLRKEMRKEFADIKSGAGATGASKPPAAPDPAPAEDDPTQGQIEQLEATLAGFRKTKFTGPLVASTEAALAALRTQRLESKTPQAQVLTLNSRLQRLKGKHTHLEQAKEQKSNAVEAARKALDEALADQAAHEKELSTTSASIAELEREVQQAVQKVAPSGGGGQPADATQQKEIVAEVLAKSPAGQQLGEGANKILGDLLGQCLAKVAPVGPPPGGGQRADASAEAPAADEDMPDAFDDTTMELLRKAATGTDAKRAMAAALRDLNMVKRVRRG